MEAVAEGVVRVGMGGSRFGGGVQEMALRGHCLSYCQRDRADFISSVCGVFSSFLFSFTTHLTVDVQQILEIF